MKDRLNLLDGSIPLQKRYDAFLVWQSGINHSIIEFTAKDLGLTVSQVDVFNELGDFDEDEFDTIDRIGYDIGLLFIVVRAPKDVRKVMYQKSSEVLASTQPSGVLKAILDEHSTYTSIEDLVKEISGDCWKSVGKYLNDRGLVSGTITAKFSKFITGIGNKINKNDELTVKQWDWIVRAIQHSYGEELGIFTNDIIKADFKQDYEIFLKINEYIERYDSK